MLPSPHNNTLPESKREKKKKSLHVLLPMLCYLFIYFCHQPSFGGLPERTTGWPAHIYLGLIAAEISVEAYTNGYL